MAQNRPRDLTDAESSYVAQVGYQLRHLPDAARKQQLHHLRKSLLAEPQRDVYSRIESVMGTPADYARRLGVQIPGAEQPRSSRSVSARDQSGYDVAPADTGPDKMRVALWLGLVVVILVVLTIVITVR